MLRGRYAAAAPVELVLDRPTRDPQGRLWVADTGHSRFAVFTPDGTFVRLPAHSADVLTEAFRRGVLKLFVERELFEPEVADQMLDWMHSGFSVHDSVWLDQDDAAAQARLARYCARCPVSLERLEYDAQTGTVEYKSDKDDGPTAGRYTFEPTAFIARLVAHIPDKGQALQRYYGYYANRTRGERRKALAGVVEPIDGDAGMGGADLPLRDVTIVEPEAFNRAEARHRWAELLRLIYEVDPLVCPRCGGQMRVVALIQDPKVIDKILRHVRPRDPTRRLGPGRPDRLEATAARSKRPDLIRSLAAAMRHSHPAPAPSLKHPAGVVGCRRMAPGGVDHVAARRRAPTHCLLTVCVPLGRLHRRDRGGRKGCRDRSGAAGRPLIVPQADLCFRGGD